MTTYEVPDVYRTRVIVQDDGCWIWKGVLESGVYGRVWLHPPVSFLAQAHRVIYELLVGPIPSDLILDHLCRRHSCVNPSHLEPVTNRENILRGVGPTAVNAKKTHCIRGHEFTEENTYHLPGPRRPRRACKECDRIRSREFRKAKREIMEATK